MKIAENIKYIQNNIADTLSKMGRKDEVTLVAVTKTHPVEVIEIALQLGIEHIGENKVQEAIVKQ